MKLWLMESPVHYMLAPNVPVLNPPGRLRLVDDPPPSYLSMPVPAPVSPSLLEPCSRT